MRECFLCGSLEKPHKHHLNWHHDDDRTDNIRTLCERCHAMVHKCGYMTKEELTKVREQVRARDPNRFQKTLFD